MLLGGKIKLTGTIKAVEDFEKLLTGSFPYRLQHDGSRTFEFGNNHEYQADQYSKKYQLFPEGMTLWGKRVNVRLHYDRRFNSAVMKISNEGMLSLGNILCKVMQNSGLTVGEDNGGGD